MKKLKILWFTDTHLDKVMPWTLIKFILYLRKENPDGIFLTGDISNGLLTTFHLSLLAKTISCPIYFVLGNHDMHFTSIETQHQKIRDLCKKHTNLFWLTDCDVIALNNEVALIGTEGWYDAQLGNPKYLKATLDWILTKDFRDLPNMECRVEAFRKLAHDSSILIRSKIEKALSLNFKNIYILTHFPPWKEATRDVGTLLEPYFLPYNVNLTMGQTIEDLMKDKKHRNVIVLSGHTHSDAWIHVARNIECKVNKAKYYGYLRNEEHIFI